MERGKLVPIIVASALVVVAILILVFSNKNNLVFEKLVITYGGEKNEYESVKVDDVLVVNNSSFWVVSTLKDEIVLRTNEVLLIEEKDASEVKVEMNKQTKACLAKENCIYFELK